MTDSPDAPSTLRTIHEPAAFNGNPLFWEEAMAARPAALPFLNAAALPPRRAAARLSAAAGLSVARDPLLADTAAAIRADPHLAALAWYLHWRVFVAPEKGPPWGAPALLTRLGNRAGAFYLLLALEFPARLAVWHRQLGYPPAVTAQTIRQIACYELNHLRGRGRPGLFENQFVWLAVYFVEPFVRLGRFEYHLHAFGGGVHAWKRPADGQILAFAESGARVSEAGLRLDATAPAGTGWTAGYEETPDAVTGCPVDPAGRILHNPVRLTRPAWQPCLAKGDPVLDLHIPAGGHMDWDHVTDSFRQALDFFPRHHPGKPFVALTCSTWFLDPRLADLLPPGANPLRLQRAAYLFPVVGGAGGLWFVFFREMANTDPAALPRDTSLQRALADYLARGGGWTGGGLFLLPADMARPRENLYRDRFQALQSELHLPPPPTKKLS